jgi:outer membrane autotransporter protein
MAPMSEIAVQTPLTQIYNIRMRLEQLRLRRNPSVIEALRMSVAGKRLPSWSAFAAVPTDKNGKPVPQKGGGAAADQDPFERLGAFINGDVEIGKQSATGLQNGYELTTKGVTAGVDYRLPGDSVVGVGIGYMRADTDLADSGGDQSASGLSFSAYGSFVPAQGAYNDVIVHGGRNKYDTRRRELSAASAPVEYTSDTRGRQFAAAVTAGADFNRGPVTMNPYGRVDYVDARIDGFNENGDAGALAIRDATFRTTIVTLGGQVSYAMSTSWGVFMPNARLELQRRVQGDNRNVTAALVADGTINTLVRLEPVDRNFGNVTVGASAVLPRGISGFVNVERLFGRDTYSNMKYTLGIRLEF